jgi:hypothetical protein
MIPPLRENDNISVSDLENCNALAEFFEDAFTPNNVTDGDTMDLVNDNLTNVILTAEQPIKYVTPSEIKELLKKHSNHKSPGHDLIPTVVLKNYTKKAISFVTSIFNSFIHKGYFPNDWKQ